MAYAILAKCVQVGSQERSAREPRSENMTIEEHLQESMESPAVRILGMLLMPICLAQCCYSVPCWPVQSHICS